MEKSMEVNERLVAELARCAAFPPHHHLAPALSRDAYDAFKKQFYLKKIERAQDLVLRCEKDSLRGIGLIEPQAWETGIFKRSFHRLDVVHYDTEVTLGALLEEAEEKVRCRGGQYLFTRFNAGDLRLHHALEQRGYITIDNLSTFSQCPENILMDFHPPEGVQIGACTDVDLPKAMEIARTAFTLDRFHADPHLPPDLCAEAHADWIRNAFLRKIEGELYVARMGSEVQGLLLVARDSLLRETTGRGVLQIVLIATATQARGKGVGKTLVFESVRCARGHPDDVIVVGTQSRNIPACRLYIDCGFNLSNAETTARKLL